MKAIKNINEFTMKDYAEFDNPLFHELTKHGFKLIDGEKDYWQNKGDTIILAVPANFAWNSQEAFAVMSKCFLYHCDEFSYLPLEGVKGYSEIIRLS